MKSVLHAALRRARQANLSRLSGLDEYALRRPMTPTGTNLLGVIKHLGGMEYGYLGETFGRSLPGSVPGDEDPDNGDLWVRVEESSDDIRGWYLRACAHADETIRELELNAPGLVPHWDKGRRETTLGAMMTLVLGEECRHGGHIDVVRELNDGRAGANYTDFGGPEKWRAYVTKVEASADAFKGKA